jgi:hypothetical protein
VPAHQLHPAPVEAVAVLRAPVAQAQVPRLASPPRLRHAHRAPVVGAALFVAAVRPDELRDVRDAEPDAVVGEGGADDGQLGADGQHELVVDHGLAAGDGQLVRAEVVLEDFALVAANLTKVGWIY